MTKLKIFRTAGGQFKNLCYLVYKDESGILIDPSWNYPLINNFLVANKIDLKGVLLTHEHIDHSGLARDFAEKNNVDIYMSGEEIDYYNFNCPNLKRAQHLGTLIFDTIEVIPILTAGHTFGSMSYLIGEHFFTGDTFFTEGVGVCNLHGSDVHKMFDAVQFVKGYVSTETKFWPGHTFGDDPGQTLSYILKHNIYFQLDSRNSFVNFRMRKNQPDPLDFR